MSVDLQSQCNFLRAKLKDWERAHFAKTGAKPGRKDVAADADIAAKYKEYEKLRSKLTTKSSDAKSNIQSPASATRKRKSAHQLTAGTPQKRLAHTFATPSRERYLEANEQAGQSDVENTPQSIIKRIVFGPTPQKNGIPVGIFDHINTELSIVTPSAKRTVLQDVNIKVACTPSKVIPATPEFEGSKFSRTPMSEGRRFMLDMFMTPRHKKHEEAAQMTPTSTDKLFQTPAFLQRYTAPLVAMDEEPTPKVRVNGPWKRSSFGRSLSSMIQEHRKQEDDKFDHEEDIMRELEDEENGIVRPSLPSKPKAMSFEDITPVKDVPNIELDEDGFIPSDVEGQLKRMDAAEAKAAEKSGQPVRIYKKKGLKRQTKRVNLRPLRRKVKIKADEETLESGIEDENGTEEEDEGEENADIVPETQFDELYDDLGHDLDELNEEIVHEKNAEQDEQDAKDVKAAARAKATKEPAKDPRQTRNKDGTTPKKKAADRNNYCKLKIKNKNSKANGRGRFGRRR